MKRFILFLTMALFVSAATVTTSSCSRKSGCPAYESAVSKPNKKGKYKKAKSGLFDKQTSKRMSNK